MESCIPKIVYNNLGVGSICKNDSQKMAIRREIGVIISDIVKNSIWILSTFLKTRCTIWLTTLL